MIEPKYAIKCLRMGFERFKRYAKLPIEIKVSKSTASFYVKKPDIGIGKNARVSNHHPNLQNYADIRNTPWLMNNVSIEFIVPKSRADRKKYGASVEQNAEGSIKDFDVTTYQYNSTIIEPNDIYAIFKAILVFLNGGEYKDPFKDTPKEAKVLPRHSNIKPYRSKPTTESINKVFSDTYLNEMTYLCIGDYISTVENKNLNCNINMKNKKVVRLTESQLHNIIAESVSLILNEIEMNPQSYETAMKEHPKLMGKVDPRTFADRERGINAFGKPRGGDRKTFQQGGVDAWNKRFGEEIDTDRNPNDETMGHDRYNGRMFSTYNEPFASRQRIVGRNGQGSYEHFSDVRGFDNDVENYAVGNASETPYYNKYQQGKNVANQMRKGSGGLGWRNNN